MSDPYIVGFRPASLDEMRKLDRSVINRILAKILFLARNVETVPHTTLTGPRWPDFTVCELGIIG